MLNRTFYLAISLLSLLHQLLAFGIFNGNCPTNITSIGKFNMDKYLGLWYVNYMFSPLTQAMPTCKSVKYEKDSSGKYSITATELDAGTKTYKTHIVKIKSIDSNVGKYTLSHNQRTFPSGADIFIVDTDYTGYATEFMCVNSDGVFNMQWAVISTRKRVPSEATLHNARKLAKQSGLLVNYLVKVNQESCTTIT